MRVARVLSVAIVIGTALLRGGRDERRHQQSSGLVVLNADRFVIVDASGEPRELCDVEEAETRCRPVRRADDLGRDALERWRQRPPEPERVPA